jgi:HAD superfamily, subfamily IIIB (Acid phosphatase)
MDFQFITHGSENSLDKDVYVIIPKPLEMREAKKLCDSFTEINANLIYIENGKINWTYKGTEDECNNSILATFNLHPQNIDCPITEKAERSYALKMLRTVRGLLSYASRTEHREIVKKALVTYSMDEKIEAMKQINLSLIPDFQKTNLIETYKFYAFQMGQTLSLLQDNVELFTKNSVANYYPELSDYLDRKETTPENLQKFYERFTTFVAENYFPIEKQDQIFLTKFHGIEEVFHPKKELVLPPVVIFDIDGTLMNEEHRAEFRDTKQWDKYFPLCINDTPFQHIVDLTHEYKNKGYEVWVMSGRPVSCEKETLYSLKNAGVYFDHIKLRGEGNFIPDYVIKPAWAKKMIGIPRIKAVYDDTNKVIDAFRKLGLNVIDVTESVLPDGNNHYRAKMR